MYSAFSRMFAGKSRVRESTGSFLRHRLRKSLDSWLKFIEEGVPFGLLLHGSLQMYDGNYAENSSFRVCSFLESVRTSVGWCRI